MYSDAVKTLKKQWVYVVTVPMSQSKTFESLMNVYNVKAIYKTGRYSFEPVGDRRWFVHNTPLGAETYFIFREDLKMLVPVTITEMQNNKTARQALKKKAIDI